MKILYIGGSGQISFDCIHESVRVGHEVSVFNRGNSNEGLPSNIKIIIGDFQNDLEYQAVLEKDFDIICQFRVFTPEEMKRDLHLLQKKIGTLKQYLFISSASCYQKPVTHYPISEKTPLENIYWPYSQKKIECEKILKAQSQIPYTIVRPSHTTRDRFITCLSEGDTLAQRMRLGKEVVVIGDGTSLWTITRGKDFAKPFVKLLGNDRAIWEDFQITSGNCYSWNQIYGSLAKGLGVEPKIVHVPTDTLIKFRPEWVGPLLGDKANSLIFSNDKLKSVVGDFDCDVSLDQFMSELVESYDAEKSRSLVLDAPLNLLLDRVISFQNRPL